MTRPNHGQVRIRGFYRTGDVQSVADGRAVRTETPKQSASLDSSIARFSALVFEPAVDDGNLKAPGIEKGSDRQKPQGHRVKDRCRIVQDYPLPGHFLEYSKHAPRKAQRRAIMIALDCGTPKVDTT